MSVGNKGGRPRKPLKLHILHGTNRADRDNVGEPQPDPVLPEAPPEVKDDPDAIREWDRVGPELVKLGILSEIDQSILMSYCLEYSKYMKASRELKKGMIFKAPKTDYPIISPWCSVSNNALQNIRQLAAELGIGAGSRTRIRGTAEGLQKPDLKKSVHRFLA